MKIKPTGLKGGDKIQRIQSLMSKLNPLNESTTNSSLEHVKYGPDGIAYAIVRENHTYFIKTSDKIGGNLISEDFEYVGGLQNKMSESHRSYEDALRHLNMKFKDLNESYNIRENINLFKSDFLFETSNKKMNNEQEDTTYKLKVDSGEETEEPMDMGADVPTEAPMSNDTNMSADMPPMDMPADTETPEETEVSDEGEDTGDLEKDIQRLTGKIGQKMRELEEPDPELEKYVINSIMSALDIDSMDEDFKEDLISKLEGDEEGKESDVEPTEEPADETPEGEEELGDEGVPTEEEPTKTESRIISKKTLVENLKNKKLLEQRLRNFNLPDEDKEYYGKFRDMDDESWVGNKNDRFTSLDNTDDWDEEEFGDYESFSSKNPNHKWFSGAKNKEGSEMMFNTYKDKFGPLKTRRRKMEEEELLDEEETMTSYKDLNDFKTNYGKLAPKSKFSVTGMEGNFMKEVNEDENIYEIELDEDSMEEGNAFTKMLSKTKKGGKFNLGGKTYKDTSSYDSHNLDEDDEIEFDLEKESKPLHSKPFDLSSVGKNKEKELDEDYDMYDEFDKDLEDDLNGFDVEFYDTDSDDNGIEDRLEIMGNKPTTAPPPVKTPSKPTTPRRDTPFKPKIKPQIQPKGRYDY